VSTATVAPVHRTHPLRSLVAGRYGYLLLAAVLAVLLIIGDGAKSTTPDAARIAYLESIIRCPSCADLSIADSEAPDATGLRIEVASDVHGGLSNAAIEARVEKQYVGTLLIPTGGDGVAIFLIPSAIIVAGAVTFVILIRRRTRVHSSVDELEDRAIVDAARRARMSDQ